MKLRQLEYFCAVAEEKSISAAARELHVAQPPISRQIAQLEEELGVQLFLRGSKGMALTDAGQSLYQQTQQVFQDIRRVEYAQRGELETAILRKYPSESRRPLRLRPKQEVPPDA